MSQLGDSYLTGCLRDNYSPLPHSVQKAELCTDLLVTENAV